MNEADPDPDPPHEQPPERRVLGDLAQEHQRQRQRLLVWSGIALAVFILAGGALLLVKTISALDVAIAPADAAASAVIDIAEGHGVIRKTRIWALRGPLTLQIGAEGFKTETLAIGRTTRERGRIDVILRELPATLHAATAPARAKTTWLIDGAPVAQGPDLKAEVKAGEHTVEARHRHYVRASREITARRGQIHMIELALTPIEGQIAITSEPDGARVTRNGEDAGTTPLTLSVEGGVHTLRIARDGYETRTDTVDITEGAPRAQRRYQLARAAARVSFELSPGGGALSVDGRAVPAPDNLRLGAGTPHRARYAAPGHTAQEMQFTLNPGEHRTIAVTLIPIYGMVEVRSDPEAEIEVNGRKAGRTPKRLKLRTVAQTIRLIRDGYRTETRTLTPEANATQNILVTLRSEAQARRATAPALYTNGAGIALKLFMNPGAITLGAHRGERGRRANEYIREVRLVKEFYAGVYEVTVGQFQPFAHPGQPPGADRRPVTGIGWEDAARYCNWLSRQEGLTPVYSFTGGRHSASNPAADGYRLLTEAEWEWLARKAGRSRETRFPWGDDARVPASGGNFADESARGKVSSYIPRYTDGFAQLAATGAFPANASGLHDLAGNASEWMHDTYELRTPPAGRVETDPMDTGPGSRHTVKGSSWRSGSLSELRAAWRNGGNAPRDDLGFRVARYLIGGP